MIIFFTSCAHDLLFFFIQDVYQNSHDVAENIIERKKETLESASHTLRIL